MATHVISRRIQNIIHYTYASSFPSKRKILDYLNTEDFNVSPRTFERDLERIRTDFGLEIVYSKTNNGYFIDEDKSVKVESFFKFLELVTIADILSEGLKDSNKIFDYVSFDDSKSFKGVDNLKDILIAIRQKRKLLFTHENFETNKFTEYVITPFLLKEYENRWYVVGVPDGMVEIRTFGVDRISNVSIGKLSNLKRSSFKNQIKSFDNVIGLFFKDREPVKVRLLVGGLHVKYMNSLPLHHSQNIHSKNDKGESFVDFFLVPNYEFMTQILKIGHETEVIYPPELRSRIKRVLQDTLNRY